MPIELGKILRDIADEIDLRPSQDLPKEKSDSAWLRVAKKNNLSVHETRSIFKVLQKKYDQEKNKPESTWKLYNILKEIHTPPSPEHDDMDEEDMSMEENEEYEMLEVDEEQQQQDKDDEDGEQDQKQHNKSQSSLVSKQISSTYSNSSMNSEGESPTKSKSDNSNDGSPERIAEKQIKSLATPLSQLREEKKVLNTLLSSNATPRVQKAMSPAQTAAAAALQKKGITLKKTTPSMVAQQQHQQQMKSQSPSQPTKSTSQQSLIKPLVRNGQIPETTGKTVQLPESIKRKLTEDLPPSTPPATKKMLLTQPNANVAGNQISPKSQKSLMQSTISTSGSLLLKKDIQSAGKLADTITSSTTQTTTTQHGGIKVITFPADASNNSNNTNLKVDTASLISNGGIITTTTNGTPTPPRIEELDFSNNIIIDSKLDVKTDIVCDEKTSINGNSNNTTDLLVDSKEGIINLGNMTDQLPRNFFSNLCNSSRYEAFALYIANVMNRLNAQKAAKLELTIMRAVIDAQSEALQDS